jgi:hypothetical protein
MPPEPGEVGTLTRRFDRDHAHQQAGAANRGWTGEAAESLSGWLAATYARDDPGGRGRRFDRAEPFALLHRGDL